MARYTRLDENTNGLAARVKGEYDILFFGDHAHSSQSVVGYSDKMHG